MTVWEIYWLTRLEPLARFFGGLAEGLVFLGLLLAALAGFAAALAAEGQDPRPAPQVVVATGLRRAFCVGLSLTSCGVKTLLPSKSDLAVIFAASWATNSEEMRKLPDNVVGTLNRFMEQYQPAAKSAAELSK